MAEAAVGNRILVMGCPGSGKSTFSIRLSRLTGLPLFHLDNIYWRADRTTVDRSEFDRRLGELLRGERWIIDGDYCRTRETRMRACDTVIFFDLDDEDACLRGLAQRLGKPRPDLPWTEEQPDPELEASVHSYRQTKRPGVYALLEKYPEIRTVIFRTRAQADQWLAALEPRDHIPRP